ncbi:hypothetical protein [Stenotrophomonas maltophilia]|uniref:hypothetical protein n=1 Tax=Stenotrophomonas maltophilia TaxID=40324 RepID=UPI001F21372A|nr:hypothetical protein [Stenotrophomonas maltophilia]MCF3486994.1 hypothetical protein [Stenotrophomonas maltophilia]
MSELRSVFLHKGFLKRVVADLGIDYKSLPTENGQRYYDWVGGGIRYWDGWREMPLGR